MSGKRNVWLPVLLMVAFAITRWPGLMPPNFSAAYALFFCAGAFFPAALAGWLPMLVMLGADVCLNIFYYHTSPLGWYMLANYAGYAVLLVLGRGFGARASFLKLLAGSLLGAVLFYLVTNSIAWLQLPYARTLLGWFTALTKGLDGLPPTWEFFRNTLLSSGLFTGLFVGAMKYSEHLESAAEKKAANAAKESDDMEEETQPEEV